MLNLRIDSRVIFSNEWGISEAQVTSARRSWFAACMLRSPEFSNHKSTQPPVPPPPPLFISIARSLVINNYIFCFKVSFEHASYRRLYCRVSFTAEASWEFQVMKRYIMLNFNGEDFTSFYIKSLWEMAVFDWWLLLDVSAGRGGQGEFIG